MMWIGLGVGVLIGAGLWGLDGAIGLGFVGWIAGLIVDSNRKAKRTAEAASARSFETLPVRLERMERAIAALEARMRRIEGGEVAAAPVEDAVGARFPGGESARAASGVSPSVTPEMPAAPASPIPPAAPEPPNPFVAWLTGGNAIARVGLLILFFGLAFLLKYMADRNLLSPELRVAGVAAAGIAMLVVGWRLRERRAGYGLAMQGGGVAVLYLTTFAALRLYHLLPPAMAFFLLAAIAALSAFIAVAQDSPILAAFGVGGGFLAPLLASTGAGSHVTLFSYYLLLNLAILAIALFKAWRGLNVMGFLFTFVIGLAWGVTYYRPEYFATTEPFLIAFFVLYVAVALLFAQKMGSPFWVDAILVFGVPIAGFGLQAALTHDMELVLAWSSVALAAFYLGLAAVLRRLDARWRPLVEPFAALGVVFATLAIPLGLDARWTSAAWALEGAAVVWFGVRQSRTAARIFGLVVEAGAGVSFLFTDFMRRPEVPLANAELLGAMLLAAAAIVTARALARGTERVSPFERIVEPVAYLIGAAWWLFAWHHEIDAFVPFEMRLAANVGLLAVTALGASLLSRALAWPVAAWPALALLWALVPCLLLGAVDQSHPFAHMGWLAWIAAIGVQVWILRRHAADGPEGYGAVLHAGSALLLAVLGAIELHWLAVEFTAHGTAWSVAAAMVVPAMVALAISSRPADERWPVAAAPRAYRAGALRPLLAALALWTLFANVTHDGRSDPLPYLPIVNALDLAQILAFLVLAVAWMGERRRPADFTAWLTARPVAIVAAALGFFWLNAVLLRSIHHWTAIPYRFDPMMRSVIVQASLSVFWSAIALALMVAATRFARRAVWMTGAVLVAVVVVKLFIVDLSNVSGVERIVSFIGVGLLLLVVGYVAPVPPRRAEAGA